MLKNNKFWKIILKLKFLKNQILIWSLKCDFNNFLKIQISSFKINNFLIKWIISTLHHLQLFFHNNSSKYRYSSWHHFSSVHNTQVDVVNAWQIFHKWPLYFVCTFAWWAYEDPLDTSQTMYQGAFSYFQWPNNMDKLGLNKHYKLSYFFLKSCIRISFYHAFSNILQVTYLRLEEFWCGWS